MVVFNKKEIARKSEDFDRWYTDVILRAELADYTPVKGCMVIRPYGFALWEAVQRFMDKRIKDRGVENAYFPLFIPEKFIQKEKEHVEGFSPQMAVVTEAGREKLVERLVIRPTSETIMYEMYKQWTQSWRDLPILINQWNNVVRWEKRTYLFLRTTEFLWQEGHCAHATHEESKKMVLWALGMYEQTYRELFALSPVSGIKSETEKFAGAAKTYTVELLMPDGRALQACTSHDLGQNFAKAFDWTVQDKKGRPLYPWQNSWGFTTRSIGGLIMTHGDDQGLVLPPNISPIQAVLIPITQNPAVVEYCVNLQKRLEKEDLRVRIDKRDEKTAGWKFNEWELKGVPLRFEVGNREVESEEVTVVRRDTGEKFKIQNSKFKIEAVKLLEEIQKKLFEKSKKFTEENTHLVDSYEQFKEIMSTIKGFIRAFWCENTECEKRIKEETKATTRCLTLDEKKEKGKCVYCGNSAVHRWYFAQAY